MKRTSGRTRQLRSGVAALRVLALSLTSSIGGAQPPARPTNLHVLDGTWSTAQVVRYMRDVSSALGVRCDACHAGKNTPTLDSPDLASDVHPAKARARDMMRLTARINEEILRSVSGPAPRHGS